jgi:hypothetical protein
MSPNDGSLSPGVKTESSTSDDNFCKTRSPQKESEMALLRKSLSLGLTGGLVGCRSASEKQAVRARKKVRSTRHTASRRSQIEPEVLSYA